MENKKCVYCGNILKGRKLKYCNDTCSYRYISMNKETVRPYSKSQSLRMVRAGRAQRSGRVGCRYN